MLRDIFIDPHGQVLLPERDNPVQAEIGGDSLQNVRGGNDLIVRCDRKTVDQRLQGLLIQMVSAAGVTDLFPALFMRRVGKEVTEQNISRGQIADEHRCHGFREAGVTLIHNGFVKSLCFSAGLPVTGMAGCFSLRILTDEGAGF